MMTIAARAATATIAFNDLPDVSSATAISNGYAGFQWFNFDYLDSRTAPPSGYVNGAVLPYNVALNPGGNAADFSRSTLFNLNSAYLTGAWNNGLQVEVQGFTGTKLTYDHTYSVNATSPTLINFNYLGVNEVNFISSGGTPAGYSSQGTQFVLADMVVSTPEPGTASLLCAGAALMGIVMIRRKIVSRRADNARHAVAV
jgi:hypothetical protein